MTWSLNPPRSYRDSAGIPATPSPKSFGSARHAHDYCSHYCSPASSRASTNSDFRRSAEPTPHPPLTSSYFVETRSHSSLPDSHSIETPGSNSPSYSALWNAHDRSLIPATQGHSTGNSISAATGYPPSLSCPSALNTASQAGSAATWTSSSPWPWARQGTVAAARHLQGWTALGWGSAVVPRILCPLRSPNPSPPSPTPSPTSIRPKVSCCYSIRWTLGFVLS